MEAAAKILLVDDELAIRHFVGKVLAREGYQVIAVESGEAALERAAQEPFDLALIDLRLKGIGGLQTMVELRRMQPTLIVIILTAHASLETAVEALRLGAHDYLFKPCNAVDLCASVRSALLKQTAPPPPAPPVPPQTRQMAGVLVDPLRHLITLDGHLLELSPTEFALLAYLVSQAPRVVPPRELAREAQGYESDTPEMHETIRSHLYHIRQKMKLTAGRDVIRNVRGVGYCLSE